MYAMQIHSPKGPHAAEYFSTLDGLRARVTQITPVPLWLEELDPETYIAVEEDVSDVNDGEHFTLEIEGSEPHLGRLPGLRDDR